MAQILIRGLSDAALATLRELAEENQRSLEAQLRTLLEDEALRRKQRQAAIAEIENLRSLFKGRRFTDSVALIREDRER